MQMFLQCDADNCDYIEVVDDITEDMVGKECPNCGENLLTEEDFPMVGVMKSANEVMKSLGIISDKDASSESPTSRVTVNCHKNKITIS